MIPTNKNIAVLHPYLDKKGGASSMMIYLSTFLQNKKNNVNLYSFSRDKIKIFSFIKIAYVIRKSDYVIIGNSPMHFVGVFSKLLFRSKAKIIWWHHHYPWYYRQKANVYIKLKRFLEKCIIKNIDSVIANSLYLQKSIKDIYKIDSKILYPVLDDKFLNHIDHPQPLLIKEGGSEKVIFSYGRWVEGKNLDMIFNVYEDLKDKIKSNPPNLPNIREGQNEFSNLVLIVGGYGEELDKFKIAYEGNRNVKIVGRLDIQNIISNLKIANLFLFPSQIDSFGLVMLESMSMGIPVISYNISGAKEIVKNDFNGYLVDSDDEFIKKSYDILSNSSLQNNLSIGAVKTANTFTINNFEKQLSEIF